MRLNLSDIELALLIRLVVFAAQEMHLGPPDAFTHSVLRTLLRKLETPQNDTGPRITNLDLSNNPYIKDSREAYIPSEDTNDSH